MNDALLITYDVVVIDPHDPQSGDGFQISLTLVVLYSSIVVAPTVKLDDQFVRLAVEVHDLRTHRMLTAELGSRQSTIAQQSPENSLRTRRIHPKLSSPRSHVL